MIARPFENNPPQGTVPLSSRIITVQAKYRSICATLDCLAIKSPGESFAAVKADATN
jgi:hypothetical protein